MGINKEKVCQEIYEETMDFIKGQMNLNSADMDAADYIEMIQNVIANVYASIIVGISKSTGMDTNEVHALSNIEERIKEKKDE